MFYENCFYHTADFSVYILEHSIFEKFNCDHAWIVLSLYMIMIRNDKFFGNNWRNIIIAEYTTGIIISEKGDLDYRIPHVYPTG